MNSSSLKKSNTVKGEEIITFDDLSPDAQDQVLTECGGVKSSDDWNKRKKESPESSLSKTDKISEFGEQAVSACSTQNNSQGVKSLEQFLGEKGGNSGATTNLIK